MLLERPTKTHSDRPRFNLRREACAPRPPRSRTSRPGSGSNDTGANVDVTSEVGATV
jgi:hypothetical protein